MCCMYSVLLGDSCHRSVLYREPQSPWKTGIAGFDMWYCKGFVIVFVIVQQSW
jgi:hypothetical protein